MLEKIASYSGVVATVWIVVGVYLAGRFYPGYDHRKQFCSELGAADSPTQTLSPRINNYPLGLLFCMFGVYVSQLPHVSILINLAGGLIVLHGLALGLPGITQWTPIRLQKIHQ